MKLELDSFQSYKDSSIRLLKEKLVDFYGEERLKKLTLKEIKKKIKELNAYPGIKNMKEIDHKDIVTIKEDIDIKNAENAILDGKILWEHAAAGEATRLGLGTKYLIQPTNFTFDKIRQTLIKEAEKENKSNKEIEEIKNITDHELEQKCNGHPKDLLPISLGLRHMLQLIYDIRKLAIKNNKDPEEIIKKQKTLIILNEKTSDIISKEFLDLNFLGFRSENVLFMEQKSFHGINIENGNLFYDEKNNKRLHNHGQMAMQKLHNNSIFHFINKEKVYLKTKEFFEFIEPLHDMISYNIEDLTYLTNSIDFKSLAIALILGNKGYEMVMEIVGQNPIKPQKGASLFFDERINKNVMIESFKLYDLKNEDLKLMNKNFNHYPKPINSLKKLKQNGLPLGFEVKKADDGKEYIYLCPVQGDINFITNTAFVTREKLKPIKAWKTPTQTTEALKTMKEQDEQKGFRELVKKLVPTQSKIP